MVEQHAKFVGVGNRECDLLSVGVNWLTRIGQESVVDKAGEAVVAERRPPRGLKFFRSPLWVERA